MVEEPWFVEANHFLRNTNRAPTTRTAAPIPAAANIIVEIPSLAGSTDFFSYSLV